MFKITKLILELWGGNPIKRGTGYQSGPFSIETSTYNTGALDVNITTEPQEGQPFKFSPADVGGILDSLQKHNLEGRAMRLNISGIDVDDKLTKMITAGAERSGYKLAGINYIKSKSNLGKLSLK